MYSNRTGPGSRLLGWTAAADVLEADDLAADITELVHVGQMIEVLVARKTKSLSDRDGHHGWGIPLLPTLVDVARMSPWRARQVVSYANSATRAPVVY